jgi:hypothetical protein
MANLATKLDNRPLALLPNRPPVLGAGQDRENSLDWILASLTDRSFPASSPMIEAI